MMKRSALARVLLLATIAIVPTARADDVAAPMKVVASPTTASADPHATQAEGDRPTTVPTANIGADARALLDAIVKAHRVGTPFSQEGTIAVDFDVAGQKQKRSAHFVVRVASPTQWKYEIKDELLLVGEADKTHLLDVAAFGFETREKISENDLGEVNAALLFAVAGKADPLFVDASDVVRTGDSGVEAKFTNGRSLKLDADPATHALRALTIDSTGVLLASGVPDVRSASISYSFEPLQANPTFAADEFTFVAPAGARDLRELNRAAANTPAGEPSALEGKPAPAIVLKDLAGAEFKLESTKGKVVLLDFWATWCGPCVKGLPHVQELHDDLKDKGLVVLAVNVQEDADTVKGFMDQKKLTIPVILDAEGVASQDYLVKGIPQSVIIGKDGTVRKVIVGYAPDAVKAAVEAAMR